MLSRVLRVLGLSLAGIALLVASGSPPFSTGNASAATPGVYGLSSALGVPASPDINVADQISTVLAGLPTPATVVLEGTYRIDHSIQIMGQADLRITGTAQTGFVRFAQGTKPSGWPTKKPFYPYLSINDSTNVTLDGFTIRGPLAQPVYNSALEFAYGVVVLGPSRNILVKGLKIRGVHGDFVMVNEGSRVLPSNITVENVYGEVAGRHGASVSGGDGVLFKSVTFLKSARSGIDIEPASPLGSRNVTVLDSTLKDYTNYCIGAHGNVFNVTVRGTSCVGGRGLGKFGPTLTYPGPDNAGLILEDVRYDWRGTLSSVTVGGSIIVQRTRNIDIARLNAFFHGGQGSIMGTGTVSDSVFTSSNAPSGVTATGANAAVVCLGAGILDISNLGTAPASACGGGTKKK
ncbi:MAG: hypothetical protein A2W26_07515 [Acidobacteria bacterium RBG_16_64_8]|nr:MAG: hypothetical protein A2W26_07515 [Acidobacteria bacterium RBG_16_64_8]